jgi:putative peptide zinc metalloprotease protein
MTQPSQLRDTSEPATVPIPAQPGPVQDASRPAPPEPAEPAEPASSADEPPVIPALTDGTTLHGEYEGGGYDEPRYLIARGDGQMVLVSRMLNEVAAATDGVRTLPEVAEEASRGYGAQLTPEATRFLIEKKLQPLGLVTLDRGNVAAPRANPLLALSLHCTLLPAKVVRRVAALFAPMFHVPVIVLVALAMLTMDGWLLYTGHVGASIHQAVGSPGLVLIVLGTILSSALFHECGHAAGCHYGGARPGKIGLGVLIVLPAFYTNVTDAYRLDRRGRLRTDLGGIYFNAVFNVFLGGIFLWTGFAPLPAVIVLIHVQMLQQLMPLIRMDGYYILGDIVGVPNLFEQIRPILRHVILRKPPERAVTNLRRRTRIVVTIWVGLVVPALLAALANMAIFLPGYLETALKNMASYYQIGSTSFEHGDVLGVVLAVFSIIILLVPWIGVSSLIVRTTAKIVRAVHRLRTRRRARQADGVQRREGALPDPELQRAE